MKKQVVVQKLKHGFLRDVPGFMDAFDRHLKMRGYRHSTAHAYLTVTKHFISWLGTRPSGERTIDVETIRAFIHKHLPVCQCCKPGSKYLKTVRAALNQVLSMNGDARIRMIEEAPPQVKAVIGPFDGYMKNVCGLSSATRWYHCRHVRMFLSWLYGDSSLEFVLMTPQALCRYVTTIAGHYRPGSISVVVYSLRTFLKYLQFTGQYTPSLSAMLPKPPNWSAGRMPQALSRSELSLFLSVFERTTAEGKRDYAMARCLIDLGLRCCEVADMQLNAIDWYQGELHLRKTKSCREDVLPIPEAMSEALLSYLRYGRPETDSPAVFVHHRAPVGQAVSNTTVRGAIRRAFSRAGFSWSGTHILRNTVATNLLEAGASLKEIADILRHRSIDTTKAYTRIDLSHLSSVALPWPGRLSCVNG
jgi:site-specific recombinase XerD